MLTLQGYGQTDQGQVRPNNEDAFWVDNDLGVYIVCDGMGGHAAGDVASGQVTTILRKVLQSQSDVLSGLNPQDSSVAEVLKDIAKNAVEHANQVVHQMTIDNPALQGMGTTLLLLLSCGNHTVVAHVGDSRLYLYRQSQIFQLSTDHTLLQEFLNRGYVSKEDAKGHPHGNVLIRAIGQSPTVEIDYLYCEMLPGDTLILCSDGLSRYLDDTTPLAAYCAQEDLQTIPGQLAQWANEQGGRDNITVVAIRPVEPSYEDTVEVPDEIYSEFYRALEILQESSLTKNLSLQGRMRLLNMMESVTFKAGSTLYVPGDTVDGLSIVLEGKLTCSREGNVVETLSAGMDLYPMALLEPITNNETISFVMDTTLLQLRGEVFRKVIKRKPWLGHRLMKNLASTLGQRLLKSRQL